MKMSKNYKRLCLVFGLSAVLCATAVTATTGTKNIQATYRNIGVTYNGVSKTLAAEPFAVDGSVYVPLRGVSEILGATVDWNASTNTVAITHSSTDTTALQQQLSTANYNLTLAQRELAQVKAELETYKSGSGSTSGGSTTSGSAITAAQLKETEEYLISTFTNELSGINFDFDLSHSSSTIYVTISYSTRNENTAFNKLSQSKIESFMKKIGDNIAVTHKDIEIQGTIEYTRDGEEKASFTRTKAGKYTYAHSFDVSDLQDAIYDELGSTMNLGSEIGKVSITSTDADIREAKGIINVKIYLSLSSDDLTKWNGLTTSSKKYNVSDQLEDVQEALLDRTSGNYDINITLYGGSSNAYSTLAEIDADAKVSVN